MVGIAIHQSVIPAAFLTWCMLQPLLTADCDCVINGNQVRESAAGLAKSTKNNKTETRRSHHESPEARHRVAAGKRPYRKPRLAEPDLMWKRHETAANPSDTGRQARMLVGHGMATMASHRRHELCAFAWRETVDETIVLNNAVSRFAGRAAVLVVFSSRKNMPQSSQGPQPDLSFTLDLLGSRGQLVPRKTTRASRMRAFYRACQSLISTGGQPNGPPDPQDPFLAIEDELKQASRALTVTVLVSTANTVFVRADIKIQWHVAEMKTAGTDSRTPNTASDTIEVEAASCSVFVAKDRANGEKWHTKAPTIGDGSAGLDQAGRPRWKRSRLSASVRTRKHRRRPSFPPRVVRPRWPGGLQMVPGGDGGGLCRKYGLAFHII
ncbi:hypothetical protein CCHR01_11290 [Colletotrichum chrysophilum]|uniref:Uncharacterized protein n=1 Tax=Colletotrichum chrysophilum TaxID=1836956 RepID=A0AAD9AEY5_9PEZI|nr:hypothetical protein CCHR01_11290 [Colletotrichum chrysophilum]